MHTKRKLLLPGAAVLAAVGACSLWVADRLPALGTPTGLERVEVVGYDNRISGSVPLVRRESHDDGPWVALDVDGVFYQVGARIEARPSPYRSHAYSPAPDHVPIAGNLDALQGLARLGGWGLFACAVGLILLRLPFAAVRRVVVLLMAMIPGLLALDLPREPVRKLVRFHQEGVPLPAVALGTEYNRVLQHRRSDLDRYAGDGMRLNVVVVTPPPESRVRILRSAFPHAGAHGGTAGIEPGTPLRVLYLPGPAADVLIPALWRDIVLAVGLRALPAIVLLVAGISLVRGWRRHVRETKKEVPVARP